MTLEEAIKHAEEKANELRETAYKDWEENETTFSEFLECRECANEHYQLAEWLKELKARRKHDLLIPHDINKCLSCEHCCFAEVNADSTITIKCNLGAGKVCKP